MDKLGSEFELGRTAKQAIFSRRKDLSEETKSEIYLRMSKESQEYNKKLLEKENTKPELAYLRNLPEYTPKNNM